MSTESLHRSFPVSGPIQLDARVAAGALEITASDRTDATVELRPLDDSKATMAAIKGARVELHGKDLLVELPEKWFGRAGHIAVVVGLPAGSTVASKVATADVGIAGAIGGLELTTATGNVDVGPVDGDAKVTSASGDVSIGAVNGDLDVKTASGNIRVGAAGTARLHTASGDLKVGRVDGDALARSASGDILVGEVWSGTVDLTTVSGRVHVAVPPGRLVWLDLSTVSGRTDSELDAEDTPDDAPVVTVRARSVSGRILVSRSVST